MRRVCEATGCDAEGMIASSSDIVGRGVLRRFVAVNAPLLILLRKADDEAVEVPGLSG